MLDPLELDVTAMWMLSLYEQEVFLTLIYLSRPSDFLGLNCGNSISLCIIQQRQIDLK